MQITISQYNPSSLVKGPEQCQYVQNGRYQRKFIQTRGESKGETKRQFLTIDANQDLQPLDRQ